jgi:hypothetical protein
LNKSLFRCTKYHKIAPVNSFRKLLEGKLHQGRGRLEVQKEEIQYWRVIRRVFNMVVKGNARVQGT